LEREGFGGLFFLHNTKLSSFEEPKSCIGGGFQRVYMNLLNLIYVLKIFLILKINES